MAKTRSNPFVDDAGAKVVDFMGDVRTLGKLGELSSKIIEMAESGVWRRYRTAVGVDEWLECEFDYFLIGCDLEYDDVYRAIKWHKLGETTRAMMDQDAGPDKRRTLEQAAAAWHAPGPETLVQCAERLHWIEPERQAAFAAVAEAAGNPGGRRQDARRAGTRAAAQAHHGRAAARARPARRRDAGRARRRRRAPLPRRDDGEADRAHRRPAARRPRAVGEGCRRARRRHESPRRTLGHQ